MKKYLTLLMLAPLYANGQVINNDMSTGGIFGVLIAVGNYLINISSTPSIGAVVLENR